MNKKRAQAQGLLHLSKSRSKVDPHSPELKDKLDLARRHAESSSHDVAPKLKNPKKLYDYGIALGKISKISRQLKATEEERLKTVSAAAEALDFLIEQGYSPKDAYKELPDALHKVADKMPEASSSHGDTPKRLFNSLSELTANPLTPVSKYPLNEASIEVPKEHPTPHLEDTLLDDYGRQDSIGIIQGMTVDGESAFGYFNDTDRRDTSCLFHNAKDIYSMGKTHPIAIRPGGEHPDPELLNSLRSSAQKSRAIEGYHFDRTVKSLSAQAQAGGYTGIDALTLMDQWAALLDIDKEGGLPSGLIDGNLTAAVVAGTMYMHGKRGQQTFLVGDVIHRLLKDTRLHRTALSEVKLPFDCMYFALPKNTYKLWGGARTGFHNVTGMYIRRCLYYEMGSVFETEEGQKENIMTVSVAEPNEKSQLWGDDANTWSILSLKSSANYLSIEAYIAAKLKERCVGEMNDVSDPLMRDMLESIGYNANPLDLKEEKEAELAGAIHNSKEHFKMVGVILNAILYLNTKDKETEDVSGPTYSENITRNKLQSQRAIKERRLGKADPKLRHKIIKLMKPTVKRLGPSIERATPVYTETDVPVRGHFRRLTDRTVWIRPYVRRKTAKGDLKELPRSYVL